MLCSTSVTTMRGSALPRDRAQLAPANPPPTTVTRGADACPRNSCAGNNAPAAAVVRNPLRFTQTSSKPLFFSGNERTRLRVAPYNAFNTAGAATAIVGSPTPPQKPPEPITIDSTFGIWLIRIEL